MKRKYRAYYRPSEDEKRAALKNAYIIFDTNALIDILRLSPELSEKTLQTIEKHKKSIHIPHHVAWEYHRHVLATSAEMFALIENKRQRLDFEPLKKVISSQLTDGKNGNRFPKDCLKNCIDELHKSYENIQNILDGLQDYYKLSFTNQGIQTRVSDLLGDCMMEGLSDEFISSKEAEWQERYDNRIPPGYMDADKAGNKFGDLIIWNEILELAKKDNKDIVFVSNDLKEDWLLLLSGKTWGPRIELLEEFDNYTGNSGKILLIYSLDQFLKQVDEEDVFNEEELSVIFEQSIPETIIKNLELGIKIEKNPSSFFNDNTDSDKETVDDIKRQKFSFDEYSEAQEKATTKSTAGYPTIDSPSL